MKVNLPLPKKVLASVIFVRHLNLVPKPKSRSKDQSKNELQFILSTIITNVNRIFFFHGEKKLNFG